MTPKANLHHFFLGRMIVDPNWERTPEERKVCLALEKVSQEVGAKNITAVAIAYVMQKVPYVFPIVGGRKIAQLHQNIEALDIALTKEHIEFIESVKPLELGFPYIVFVSIFLFSIDKIKYSTHIYG